MDETCWDKLAYLEETLRSFSSALVSCSGGVDSTLLAVMTRLSLGESMAAVTIGSPLLPPREMDRAVRLAGELGFPSYTVEADELALPDFRRNPEHRCYICKRHRLLLIKERALQGGYREVLDGSNADDAAMYRPGRKALEELGVRSPLHDAGLTKAEIRAAARKLRLPNWDAPSRPCLATRIPYGMEIRPELLHRVDAAEEELERLGFKQIRVRLQSADEARIELGADEMEALAGKDKREALVKKMASLGFRRILLDLEGYRTGSMDEETGDAGSRTIDLAGG